MKKNMKLIIITALYSIIISFVISYVTISVGHQQKTAMGLSGNVRSFSTTISVPDNVINKNSLFNQMILSFSETESIILFKPYDTNGIGVANFSNDVFIIGSNIKIETSSNDFLFINDDTFVGQNFDLYDKLKKETVYHFNNQILSDYDYIFNLLYNKDKIEGDFIIQSSCNYCFDEFLAVQSDGKIAIDENYIQRSVLLTIVNNSGSVLMVATLLLITFILTLYIRHTLYLEEFRYNIQRLYGATSKKLMYRIFFRYLLHASIGFVLSQAVILGINSQLLDIHEIYIVILVSSVFYFLIISLLVIMSLSTASILKGDIYDSI